MEFVNFLANGNKNFLCGGALINKDYVLTGIKTHMDRFFSAIDFIIQHISFIKISIPLCQWQRRDITEIGANRFEKYFAINFG